MATPVEGGLPINGSLIAGAAVAAFVGFIVSAPAGYVVLTLIGFYDLINVSMFVLMFGGLIAVIYFTATLHTTPVGHRGVWLFLGKRIKMGKSSREVVVQTTNSYGDKKLGTQTIEYYAGWGEGLVSTIFPPPIASVQDVDCLKKNLKYEGMDDVYAKDGGLVRIDGVKQYQVVDPHTYLGYEEDEAESTLLEVGKRAIRKVVSKHDTLKVPFLDRAELSEEVEQELLDDLLNDPDTKDLFGLKIDIIRLNTIRLADELESALRQRVQEGVEKELEAEQVGARVDQLKKLTATGISPDVAAAMTLIDAKKEGASLNVYSGLSGGAVPILDPQSGSPSGIIPGAGGQKQNKPKNKK